MARIGIDARLPLKTGVGDYTWSLISYLEDLLTDEDELYIFTYSLADAPIKPKKNIHLFEAHFMWHSFAEQGRYLKLLNSYKLDLMHFTYFSFPILYRRPYVITIHDLTPLLYPTGKASTKNPLLYKTKHAAYSLLMRTAVKKSKHIIVPSQTVKEDICHYYSHQYEKKISVTYEGIHVGLLNTKPKKPELKLEKPFYIYLGNFYPHKNVQRLILAFKDVKSDCQLILLGPDDVFAQKNAHLIREHHLEDKVLFYPSPSDEEVVYFYKHAEALIHPSLAEGFGMTPLEASYFECPVIASDIPIFQETLGKYFEPIDPYDEYNIAAVIDKKRERKFVPRKIIDERFSFKKMAQQTYDIYTHVLRR